MKPPAFRRGVNRAPQQKLFPDVGDRVFVFVDGGWISASVSSSIEFQRYLKNGKTPPKTQAMNDMVVALDRDGTKATADVRDYLSAWCWPHDVPSLIGRT